LPEGQGKGALAVERIVVDVRSGDSVARPAGRRRKARRSIESGGGEEGSVDAFASGVAFAGKNAIAAPDPAPDTNRR